MHPRWREEHVQRQGGKTRAWLVQGMVLQGRQRLGCKCPVCHARKCGLYAAGTGEPLSPFLATVFTRIS